MNAITHLPSEWQNWIRENLARGCAPQSLIDDMVRNRFDPVFARAAVNGVMTNSAPATAPVRITAQSRRRLRLRKTAPARQAI